MVKVIIILVVCGAALVAMMLLGKMAEGKEETQEK